MIKIKKLTLIHYYILIYGPYSEVANWPTNVLYSKHLTGMGVHYNPLRTNTREIQKDGLSVSSPPSPGDMGGEFLWPPKAILLRPNKKCKGIPGVHPEQVWTVGLMPVTLPQDLLLGQKHKPLCV